MYKILITTSMSRESSGALAVAVKTNVIKFKTRQEADDAILRIGAADHSFAPFAQSTKALYK